MFKEKYKMKKVGFVFTKAVSEKAVIKYDISVPYFCLLQIYQYYAVKFINKIV
jgi:hypothetical protein